MQPLGLRRVGILACGAMALVLTAKLSCQTRRLGAGDIPMLPSQPPTTKISYGQAPQQFAELRLPATKGPFPVVVVLHGGCWVQYADVAYTAPLASALTKEGWATWNLEYRRAHEEGGAWPGTFQDVAKGVDALRESAGQYHLDLSRVVVMGHSAGGQLALWTGGRRRIPTESPLHTANPLPLRGVVSLAGIADMRAYAERGPQGCAEGGLRVMGGTAAQQPARYAAASPIELLPLGTPQVLVWGEEDTIVPEKLFEDYEVKAKKSGDSVEIIRVPQIAHHELCSPESPSWPKIVGALKKLLQ
ncbi:MAG TPA: alpha/beta hydrolase [Bryobacteraceae bacterium]|nr:alpha/beta hydrolase [Bryobacteraceae bacterium]